MSTDRKFRCSLLYSLLLFVLTNGQTTSDQSCQANLTDYFYRVNSAGPFFDQSVYTKRISIRDLQNRNGTQLFNFTVLPQTIDLRPSFPVDLPTGYQIDVTSSHPKFDVRRRNGFSFDLIVAANSYDYFVRYHRYLFTLTATQTVPNRPSLTATAIVQIDLINGNANAPRFVLNESVFYISETAQVGTKFGTVYAIDADNDTIRYSMSNAQFSIDPVSGVLELQQAIHRGSPPSYSPVVTICDECSSSTPLSSTSASATITIFVTAVNKHSPRFIDPPCGSTLDFDENNTVGQMIGKIVVADDDRGDNGRITISFPSEESRNTISGYKNTAYVHFTINQSVQLDSTRNATIRANKTFYYDTPGATRVWYLYVLATDHGSPPRQSFCSFRVNLRDINNNAPVFVMPFWNYTIYRSAFLNAVSPRFLRIIAYDADSGANGRIEYHIATPKIPYFTIDRLTGTIRLQQFIGGITSLNASYFPITFEVFAEDRGTPAKRSERYANVTIYYDASASPPPARWLDPRYEELDISISEKFYEDYPNRNIFDLGASFNGSIIYQLASSASSLMTVQSPFSHDNQAPFRDAQLIKNGQIFSSGVVVTRGLHAEIQQDYFLCITVLVRPPLIGSINIHLIDKNDQSPMFDIRSIILSVIEQEAGYRSLAQIQAFDRDVDPRNNQVIYSLNEPLTDPEALGKFFVAENGTIWTNRTFEGENDPAFYRIFIRASDMVPAWNSPIEPNTEDFQFDIQVISVNTKPPVFVDASPLIIVINETTSRGTRIRNLTITDPDLDTRLNFGILSGNFQNAFTFTLLSNNADDPKRTRFEAVGQLVVVGPLSYEVRQTYRLVLFVSDSQNTQVLSVTVQLLPENTEAPEFQRTGDSMIYQFEVDELSDAPVLKGHCIEAIDSDDPPTRINYSIYNTNHQLNLDSLYLNQSGNRAMLAIKLPGLVRDLPLGSSVYNFAIRATDEDGRGVSSYIPVRLTVRDINNNGPVPKTRWPIMPEGVTNPTVQIEFVDFDDASLGHTTPFEVHVLTSQLFISRPTSTDNGTVELMYTGVLNRTLVTNLTVTFNATDNGGVSRISEMSIIVGDRPDQSPISDGHKTIDIIYVKGYANSLKNVDLGSVFVENSDDWFLADNNYAIIGSSIFRIFEGLLRTPAELSPGFYTVNVDVTKRIQPPSTARSTISLQVTTVDSEFARQAATLRIQGEFPETFIDPTLGNMMRKLRQALASILVVSENKISILAVRPVKSYRSFDDRPLTLAKAKEQALLDVFFSVPSWNQYQIESRLNENLSLLRTRFGITAVISGPDPCEGYLCPHDTICRSIRTIQPKPSAIDTNRTSFVGIDLLDAPFCVNHHYPLDVPGDPKDCTLPSVNNRPFCSCTSLEVYQPLGRYCQVLGRVFDEGGGAYAQYSGESFSTLASAHFSFDFATRRPDVDGLILLYGKDTAPIDDFFWIAIEIQDSKLRFHFRGQSSVRFGPVLNASTSYYVQCQFVDAKVIISINDCQYEVRFNDTSIPSDLSSVQLYLGGLPTKGSLINRLYPSLKSIHNFSGCIRNVLSNGVHLDMARPISSEKSHLGPCPCALTSSCTERAALSTSLVPWYIWLIMALVFLLLTTVLTLILLTCLRRRRRSKALAGLYVDDTRDTIIDYKESAGEEDHSNYNLRVLQKLTFALTDDEIRLSTSHQDRMDPFHHPRSSLGDYIDQQLNKYQMPSYVNDTSRRYEYEGDNPTGSDLSSIDSFSLHEEHLPTLLRSLGPKFSALADLYTDND